MVRAMIERMRVWLACAVVVIGVSLGMPRDADAKCRALDAGKWMKVSTAGFTTKLGELDGPVKVLRPVY
jgi:hypothetical protein